MRTLEYHKVNPANDTLTITVMDEPASGGACHLYFITGFNSANNPSDPQTLCYGKPSHNVTVLFQQGPIAEVGVNGVTHEALLAILADRLQAFQDGPFANEFNASALDHIRKAMGALKARTLERMQRGVEGTHQL